MDSTPRFFFRKPILLHELENFSLLDQDGCWRESLGFIVLRNQYVTSIWIQEKMEDLGEKMKTHVLKISPGSWAHGSASGEVRSHKDFWR